MTIHVCVFSPFPPSELMCTGETPKSRPIPACRPGVRVTPYKTLLWHPCLASIAISVPISPIVDPLCLFVNASVVMNYSDLLPRHYGSHAGI